MSLAGVSAAAAYKKAYTILLSIKTERERAHLHQLQLRQQQIKALRASCEELSKALGFKSLADLHRRTNDPEVTLKLLSAQYRRMNILVDYQSKGKAQLPIDDDI